MLRELSPATRNEAGQRRRWYFSQTMDLVVWLDETDAPVGFQLAYDKQRGERSIAWHSGSGYRHYRVDEGPALAGNTQTPLLHAAGGFPQARVIALFAEQAAHLPPDLVRFVQAKLENYA